MARTTCAVAVATPESRPRKFSAVRSPVSSARAGPETRSTGAGGSRHSPSGPSRSTTHAGSSRWNTASATSSPEITPGAFCVIVATPRADASTVASDVTSPAPTSSASAASTRSVMVTPTNIAVRMRGQSPQSQRRTKMVRKSGSLAPWSRAPESLSSRRYSTSSVVIRSPGRSAGMPGG